MAGIRKLTIGDIQQARELSDAEGWNQTDNDWKLLVTSPGNVCLAYTTGEKVIATATAMNYNNELAWIGMVLVHREHRGRGLSKLLLNELLLKLKPVKLVKLDATPAGQPVYAKMGFKDEYTIYRMISDAGAHQLIQPAGELSAVSLIGSNLAEVIQYDRNISGAERKPLINFLVKEFPDTAFILKKKGKMNGFALGRKGVRFSQIGPIMAESTNDARNLLLKAISSVSGKPIVIDIPEDKNELINWLHNSGFQIQRQFVRMHFGEKQTPGPPAKQFLICGPEYG